MTPETPAVKPPYHLPWKVHESSIYFAKVAGGFDVRNCPEPLKLAAYIHRACNEYPALASENARLVAERDALAREIEGMREALRELLQYLDDHDWGNIPEGVTAERARAALTLSKKESVE